MYCTYNVHNIHILLTDFWITGHCIYIYIHYVYMYSWSCFILYCLYFRSHFIFSLFAYIGPFLVRFRFCPTSTGALFCFLRGFFFFFWKYLCFFSSKFFLQCLVPIFLTVPSFLLRFSLLVFKSKLALVIFSFSFCSNYNFSLLYYNISSVLFLIFISIYH